MTAPRASAFTLVEMLIVVAITAMLVALLLPALQKSRNAALTLKCAASIRQIGLADETYRTDYNRWFVAVATYVPALAQYTGTSPEHYLWQGYGNSHLKYRQAHPFKCPLVTFASQFTGPYEQGVMTMTSGGVTDYSLNTALHMDTVSSNQYITRRRDTQLTHTPSQVLNFLDARGGTMRTDYSTFSADFRHNDLNTINIVYVDGHTAAVRLTGIVNLAGDFNRGGNNTTIYPDRPYFWW